MANYNVTGAGGTTGHPSNGRTPYLVENTINIAAVNGDSGTANGDILQALDIPAETVILHAGIEVLTACSSSVVLDLGTSGTDAAGFIDADAFVDAYDATGATYAPRDVANAAPVVTCKVADTLDVLVAGANSTAGKIRVFAVLCDVSGIDEDDNNTDAQHDTAV
jgi:hypothetical protein